MRRFSLALVTIVLATGVSQAAESPSAPEVAVIKTLPGIVVDLKAKEVRLEGIVCLQKGALELLICSKGTREHESVVVVQAKPSHVTFALSLLGLGRGQPGYRTESGAFSPPAGAAVDILVRFSRPAADGKAETVEVPAWKLLRPSGSQSDLEQPLQWVYVGLAGKEDLVASDREGTVVCLSNFPEAVLDVPFASTSANADLLYEANPRIVPAVGTPVEVILRPTGQVVAPKKVEIVVVLRKGQPVLLDGQAVTLDELRRLASGMPATIQSAVLKADADEPFGRVMEVKAALEDALMRVRLMVAGPEKAAAAPLAIFLAADGKVRVGPSRASGSSDDKAVSLEEFRAKAAELLKGVTQVNLTAEAGASAKAAEEVMGIVRGLGATVELLRAAEPTKN
jgi:biopolymer transport protein ExbD